MLSEQWANENDSNISKMEKMERQVQRKIQEQYLAIELEKKVNDKNWILENYLNSINLAQMVKGEKKKECCTASRNSLLL